VKLNNVNHFHQIRRATHDIPFAAVINITSERFIRFSPTLIFRLSSPEIFNPKRGAKCLNGWKFLKEKEHKYLQSW
jgi:hypothetical protein